LMKARVGDVMEFRTPSEPETVEVLSIEYAPMPLQRRVD